jgi:hypothetical protein
MEQSDEKTVTNLVIRAVYDSLAEVMGQNARDIVFRAAGLERLVKQPPEYNWDREFTRDQQLNIYLEIVRLVGRVGAQGILRLIGYKNSEISVVGFHIFDHLKELPPGERFIKAIELFSQAVHLGNVVPGKDGLVSLDVPECLMCRGITSHRPYCSQYAGAITFFADWTFGKGKYLCIETRCKALGDDTCLFELKNR